MLGKRKAEGRPEPQRVGRHARSPWRVASPLLASLRSILPSPSPSGQHPFLSGRPERSRARLWDSMFGESGVILSLDKWFVIGVANPVSRARVTQEVPPQRYCPPMVVYRINTCYRNSPHLALLTRAMDWLPRYECISIVTGSCFFGKRGQAVCPVRVRSPMGTDLLRGSAGAAPPTR